MGDLVMRRKTFISDFSNCLAEKSVILTTMTNFNHRSSTRARKYVCYRDAHY